VREISAAMALAFAKIEGAVKGKTNPAFRSKYADLAAVVDAIKPALAEHGLWFRQITHPADGGVCVETVIHHSSGESLACGPLFVPASKQDAQGFGSALTYCRRYSLMAAFGVPAEDDDGNAAVASKPPQKPPVAINDTESAMVLDSLREAAMGGLDALQARFKTIPNSATKAAVWERHQGELKAVAARVHMPEVPAFPGTKVAA
jgi:ERF superfamily